MAKIAPVVVAVGKTKYDLSKTDALPVDEMTNAELCAVFNQMAGAVAGAHPDFDPDGKKTAEVKKFKDSETGRRRIAALHSSITAYLGGLRAEAGRGKTPKEPKTPKTNGSGRRGRSPTFHLKTIRLGSVPLTARAKRYAEYRDGITVEEYARTAVANSLRQGRATKTGQADEATMYALALGDVRYDAARGVITLS